MSAVAVIRRSKPAITVIGVITHIGTITRIEQWGLGACLTNCGCHRHPASRQLAIEQGANGQLGLRKYRACSCCEPWTWRELQGFLTDLAGIAGLPGTPDTEEQLS